MGCSLNNHVLASFVFSVGLDWTFYMTFIAKTDSIEIADLICWMYLPPSEVCVLSL